MATEQVSARVLNGVDFSNWQGPLTTPELADCRERFSLSFSIHGTQNPDITHQQIAHSREAEIPSQELYVWMRQDESQVKNLDALDEAIVIAEPYGITRIAFDCERSDLDGTTPTWEQAQAAGSHMQGKGFTPILYTNPATWEMWGSPAIPEDWEIWLADWTYLTPVPASEWQEKAPSALDFQSDPPIPTALQGLVKTIQWQGTTALVPGVNADLNVRLEFDSANPVQEPAHALEPGEPAPTTPVQVIEQQPIPGADSRVWIVKQETADFGLQGLCFNGPFIEVYNGPQLPVWRWGSADDARPGQISKLFGDAFWWLGTDPQTAIAKWLDKAAD